MNKKINLVELLKDCHKGMELDCVICNGVTFVELDRNPNYPIVVVANDGYVFSLTKYGKVHNIDDAKCVIFPKGKTTWEGINIPFKDGDIVSTDDGMFTAIVGKVISLRVEELYDHNEEYDTYCHIYYEEYDDKSYFIADATPLRFDRLATEEEKERLFQAIKYNGYEWNPETKTLKELIKPRFKEGDRIKDKNNKEWFVGQVFETHFDISSVPNAEGYFVSIEDQDNYELVPDKFNITELKPFDKVLVKFGDVTCWKAEQYSHYDNVGMPYSPFCCIGACYDKCIPYEGNEHLLGTEDDCDEYYKTWE